MKHASCEQPLSRLWLMRFDATAKKGKPNPERRGAFLRKQQQNIHTLHVETPQQPKNWTTVLYQLQRRCVVPSCSANHPLRRTPERSASRHVVTTLPGLSANESPKS